MRHEILGFVMVGSLFVAIFAGFPIAFTLIILGVVFGYIGFGELVAHLLYFQTFNSMRAGELAAVPLFLLMGYLLERADLMGRLFRSFQLMFGGLKGSLYVATLGVSTVLAAATGVVGASVSIMGLMAAPSMRRSGYDPQLSAGAIAAGGTLGILLPPSVMLVVMGPIFQVSIVRLFAAAIVPGLLLATLYVAYTVVRCHFNPALGPPLPPEERIASKGEIAGEFFRGVVPPLILVGATLGTILAGLATPTEGAGMGALGTLILLAGYRKLSLDVLRQAVVQTGYTSCMILFLVAASNFFGAVFSRLGTPTFIAESLISLELSPIGFLILLLALVFVLGWPLEWIPIVVIVLPIFLPLIKALGFDLIWFSTLVAVTLQTAWLSPPVALSAYFLKSVVPEWQLKDIYMGMLQFMGLQVAAVGLLIMFPELVLWLPRLFFG
jgi:tripartite ATP-independent transporter DctM subunit